jgi:predicted DNA-binding transcriptional regulator AlpA
MDQNSPTYLRTPAAADYLGVSESYLEKQRISGNGPEFIKIGKSVLYARTALDAFAQRRTRRSTSDMEAA